MIYTGQQPLVRNVPRVLETLILSLRRVVGFPTPVLLQALAEPLKTAPLTAPATPSVVITYPALSSAGNTRGSTLVGASLHGSVLSRHFSSTSKPEVVEPHQRLGKLALESETSVSADPKISRPKPIVIAQSAWNYSLDKIGDQHFLLVLYGRVAQNILNIPLNPEETALALSGKASLDQLAKHIQQNISHYKPRHISPG